MSSDSPAVILFDDLGNPIGITQDGYIYRLQTENIVRKVIPTVSMGNSTAVTLAANGIFSGASEDVSGFVSIDITVLSDVDSADQGLLFEFSQDNVIWNYSESFTILAGVGSFYSLAPRAKYFRSSYTNGTVAQTSFALTTVYYPIARSEYIQNLDTDIPAQKAVDVVRSVVAAQKSGAATNTYTNLQATNNGILRVSIDTNSIPPILPSDVVQQNYTSPNFGNSFSTTLTNTAIGNTLIILVMQSGITGATYDLSDSHGIILNSIASVNVPDVGQIDLFSISISFNGPDTITANNFSFATTVVLQVYEVSGLSTDGNLLDLYTTNTGTSTSLIVGPIIPNYNAEFCISAFVSSDGYLITGGMGWSQDLSLVNFEAESQTQNSAVSVTGTASTIFPVTYVGLLATFLPATTNPLTTTSAGQLLTETEITDGYNGPVNVTAPFTPATSADSALVVAISPNTPFTITEIRSSTSTTSSVAASSSNVILLPSNFNRLGATVYNDSMALLYLKLGAIATITDFTIKMFPLSYYEVPYGYTGQIDAIWSSSLGFARLDELTP